MSDEWRDVTKLSYTVTVNGSSPETLKVSPPSFEMMEAELKKVNKAQCPCYAKKAQKEYLLGTKTSIKVNKVQEALMSAWTSKNPGTIHSLILSIFCLEILRSLGRKITRNFETIWVSSVKMYVIDFLKWKFLEDFIVVDEYSVTCTGIQGQKLTVRIKDVTSRQKRETDSATIKTKLVGKDKYENDEFK